MNRPNDPHAASGGAPALPERIEARTVAAMDAADPLAGRARRFLIGDETTTEKVDGGNGRLLYLDGNSLGPPLAHAPETMAGFVRKDWGGRLIAGWYEGWFDLPERLGDRIARLVGAPPGSVLVADSTSVNLYKLARAGLAARPGRRRLLIDADDFPTDRYLFAAAARDAPGEVVPEAVPGDGILAHIDDDTALVAISHVDYRTARVRDMRAIVERAHEAGALVLFDLSHSAGALAVDLAGAGVDLAVGCGYKFLNGGPGAPAFLYVRPELLPGLETPLPGWIAHRDPMRFAEDFVPADGIRRFACGTPPVAGLKMLETALAAFDDIDMRLVEAKGRRLASLFLATLEAAMATPPALLSPRDESRRGHQISLGHPRARDLMAALARRGVVGDFRPPDIMRFGFSALTLSYRDVWRAACLLAEECAP